MIDEALWVACAWCGQRKELPRPPKRKGICSHRCAYKMRRYAIRKAIAQGIRAPRRLPGKYAGGRP